MLPPGCFGSTSQQVIWYPEPAKDNLKILPPIDDRDCEFLSHQHAVTIRTVVMTCQITSLMLETVYPGILLGAPFVSYSLRASTSTVSAA